MPDYPVYPTVDTLLTNIGLAGAASAAEALDDLEGADDGDATKVARGGATLNGEFRMQKGTLPALASIQSVRLDISAKQDPNGGSVPALIKPYLYINSVKQYLTTIDAATSASFTVYTQDMPTVPGLGGEWTKGVFEAMEFGFEFPRDEGEFDSIQQMSHAHFVVSAIPAEPGVSRNIATAFLHVVRRPLEFCEIAVDLAVLEHELMSDVLLQHVRHPLTRILGKRDLRGILRTGREGWRGVVHQIREVRLDLNSLVPTLTLRRRRGEFITFFDGGWSKESASNIEDGVERFTAGGEMFYIRASRAWNTDPATGLVVPYEVNERPLSVDGFTPENFTRNWVVNSSFVSNLTGIGSTGDGSSVREQNPPEPLFREDVSDYALLMTGGSPHVNARVNTWTCVVTEADVLLRVSIDHRDGGSATALEWALVRSDDSKEWNNSTLTFVTPPMGGTWNTLTLSATRSRYESGVIPGGPATTYSLKVRIPTGGSSGRTYRLYDVQFEDNGHGLVTSRIVTDGFVGVREVQIFGGTNNEGTESFNNAFGTMFVELVPHWTSAHMASIAVGAFPPVFSVIPDADGSNNYWKAFYNGPAGELSFVSRAEGVEVSAGVPCTAVNGESMIFAVRWLPIDETLLGANALNLPAGTMSAFLNGVKGTDVTRAADPTMSSTGSLYVGTDPSGIAFSGVVRRTCFKSEILSDEEIAAFKW